jgi:putative ABC transport system permease protein
MILRDNIDLGLRNLRQAKLRTTLTTSGIAIGIGALACLVGFAVRMQAQFEEAFVKSGLFDTITVTRFPIMGLNRQQPRPGPPRDTGAPILDDAAVSRIGKIDRVVEVYPNVRVPVEVRYEKFSEFTTAAGVAMSSAGKGIFADFTHGGFFASANDDACLITSRFAERIAGTDTRALVGRQVVLVYARPASSNPVASLFPGLNLQRSEARYRICGITENQTGPMYGFGITSPIMIPLPKAREMGAFDLTDPTTLLQRLSEQKTYASIVVKVRRPQDAEHVQARLKEMGFSAFSINDALQNARRTFILFDIFMALIGSVALSVSSLGIVNTMVMSILERTREIGIMKAIGAGDGDIRYIFLFEAGIMGLFGGIFGILLGWMVSKAVNFGLNIYLRSEGFPPEVMFSFPWWLMVGGIAFSILVSVLAGTYPSSRAARLDPIQALRHD